MKRFSIHIADDSPIIRQRLLAAIQELAAFEIAGVSTSGREALAMIRRARPDFLILDLTMPNGSGLDVLKTLRLIPAPPVVIVLTNHPAYRERCLEAGAQYFFDKSAEFDDFLLLMDQLDSGAVCNLAATYR